MIYHATKISTNINFSILAILLGKHPEVTKDHLKHVKYMVCGAAPLSASDANAVLEKSNVSSSSSEI